MNREKKPSKTDSIEELELLELKKIEESLNSDWIDYSDFLPELEAHASGDLDHPSKPSWIYFT